MRIRRGGSVWCGCERHGRHFGRLGGGIMTVCECMKERVHDVVELAEFLELMRMAWAVWWCVSESGCFISTPLCSSSFSRSQSKGLKAVLMVMFG